MLGCLVAIACLVIPATLASLLGMAGLIIGVVIDYCLITTFNRGASNGRE